MYGILIILDSYMKLQKRSNDKNGLSKDERIENLEKQIEILIHMKSQLVSVRNFLMDKTMVLINQLEMIKKINSNLSLDDWGMTALAEEDPPASTIHQYLGMNFNEPDEEGWKGKLRKYINKRYHRGE